MALTPSWKRALMVSLVLTTLFACGDYEIALPRGYFIASLNADQVVLVAPDRHIIIPPTIIAYRVYGELLVGERQSISTRDFFVVDLRSGDVEQGLTRDRFAELLRAHRITNPRLTRPTPLQQYFAASK